MSYAPKCEQTGNNNNAVMIALISNLIKIKQKVTVSKRMSVSVRN
jgi:hypothetical protein